MVSVLRFFGFTGGLRYPAIEDFGFGLGLVESLMI